MDGTYRARWIVPVRSDPIHGGYVRFREGAVIELGHRRPERPYVDLGDVALLPGLVNAHTHLEFSECERPLGQPGMELAAWIAEVVRHRAAAATADPATDPAVIHARRVSAIRHGLDESTAAGVALVGEVATDPWPIAELREDDPDLAVFAEVLGLTPERQRLALTWAGQMMERRGPRIEFGISPHAPYSTTPELVDESISLAAEHEAIVAMHIAESPAETALLERGEGPFREALERIGVWRSGLFPNGMDLTTLMRRVITARRVLVVHGNYLTADQIATLAELEHVSVVYCPRTHHFFRHSRHPIAEMRSKGLRVVLGTDSRASNPDLSVWNEARFLREARSDLGPGDLLRMISLDGALALGRQDMGSLAVGARPGMIVVPSEATEAKRMLESLWEADPRPISAMPEQLLTDRDL